MRRRFAEGFVICVVVGGVLGSGGCASRPAIAAADTQPGQDTELGRIQTAVTRALTARPPRGYAAIPEGVRLLSVSRDSDGTIVLNVSAELLTGSSARVVEDSVRQMLTAASSARTPAIERVENYRVLVNGIALDTYLP